MTTTELVPHGLTAEQRAIVAWEDGPLVVVAGAGTGKTRVIVERVRRLLESKGRANGAGGDPLRLPPEAATADRDLPFAGPLLPEQVLVLTYNVNREFSMTVGLGGMQGAVATQSVPLRGLWGGGRSSTPIDSGDYSIIIT